MNRESLNEVLLRHLVISGAYECSSSLSEEDTSIIVSDRRSSESFLLLFARRSKWWDKYKDTDNEYFGISSILRFLEENTAKQDLRLIKVINSDKQFTLLTNDDVNTVYAIAFHKSDAGMARVFQVAARKSVL